MVLDPVQGPDLIVESAVAPALGSIVEQQRVRVLRLRVSAVPLLLVLGGGSLALLARVPVLVPVLMPPTLRASVVPAVWVHVQAVPLPAGGAVEKTVLVDVRVPVPLVPLVGCLYPDVGREAPLLLEPLVGRLSGAAEGGLLQVTEESTDWPLIECSEFRRW